MEPEPKSSRRRRRNASQELRRRRIIALGGLVAGAAAIVAVVVVLVLFVFGGGTSDKGEIESLARRSIEVLPAGEWPSLYDSFTSEFHERCPRAEFIQAGQQAMIDLGDDLPFLRFKRVENVAIQGDNARAEIVGQVAGEPEYKSLALFRKEDGEWKLSFVADSEGCLAFGPVEG